MSIGNPNSGLCQDCGSILKEVVWCENDHCECSTDCPSYPSLEGCDCVMRVDKLKCPSCNTLVDPD